MNLVFINCINSTISLLQSVIPFMIVAGLVKINVIVTYIVAIAAGLSVAAAFLLPW